ncbi:histidine phosphatase family protein [uncultured Tateyamaria sp.]|uniref:histidine phosphatase family protein n=1 Tax=uncultured Tateyamaria sp. TaxID=455651 RepID=UPI0026329D7F|nr:histidine phosphatase family protein [uncultured Tateyamaria sp.]
MPKLLVVTHPEVVVEPDRPIPDWRLSETGRNRATAFATSAHMAHVSDIWCSTERKAHDTAAILAVPCTLPVNVDPALGENDRSATGFLPPAEFEAAADEFFANPSNSFRGWEPAVDAQARICQAIQRIASQHSGGDLAIVTHGAVGTLLWCHLMHRPIDRTHDQPSQGHFWQADLSTLRPQTGWLPIA